jgi:hypothetical protein
MNKLKKSKYNGIELWRGQSFYDGKLVDDYAGGGEIVVIATGFTSRSTNIKTGGMIQVYILATAGDPVTVSNNGEDSAQCGSCKHRHSLGGACYVNLGHGPNAVYKAWKAGRYPKARAQDLARLRTKRVRLGAYGDIAALPLEALQLILPHIRKHTGYTHGWQAAAGDRKDLLQRYTVASVDNEVEQLQAANAGWSTFRVMPTGGMESPVTTTLEHLECLNTTHGTECIDCLLCSGTSTGSKLLNIYIGAHGSRAKRFTV